jgi:heat shock protein HtpX
VLTATALVVSALVPFLFVFLSSRGLLTRLDDPLLPDRLLAHSRRVGPVIGGALGTGLVLAPSYFPVIVLLGWVSALAGGFRARRAVFDERWGFFSYLDHTLRFWIGLLGSFALTALIPWSMSIAGESALAVGLAVGGLAWLWILAAPFVFRALVRARPLPEPEAEALSTRFASILERASCPTPALYRAEARGGTWINAFALPAVRRPGVLFTRGFLEALTTRETAAIFAHEVAHLEHFTPRKVLYGRLLAALLVALPIFLWAGPTARLLRGWELLWPFAFLIAMILKTAKSRGHEAESDRRALELCADPEALVSGLTKLHALNRISRRWDTAFESVSTHPSLARRLRAIRALSRTPREADFSALFHASDGSRRAVLFDASRVHFLEELPPEAEEREALLARSGRRRSYRYEDLHALRLKTSRELELKSASGETVRMSVRAEDVAAVEGALDRVDGLLGETPAAAEPPVARLWSLVLGLFALLPSPSWVAVALAGAAFARPSFHTLLALGVSGLASAAVLPEPWWRSASLALASIAAILVAARKRNLPPSRREALLAALVPLGLVLISSLSAVPALASAIPVMYGSLWASETPSAVVGLIALGAVLLSLPKVGARIGGVLALTAALAVALLGSTRFRERFGGDLFASAGDPVPVEKASLAPIREVRIPGYVSRISISPRGGLAVALASADEEAMDSEYLVETGAGKLETLRALALEYLDEERILFVERSDARAILKVAVPSDLGSAAVIHPMPLLAGLELDADSSGSWLVSGYDWVEGSRVLVWGGLDSVPPEEIRFSSENDETLLAASRQAALAARYDLGAYSYFPFFSSSRLLMELEMQTKEMASISLGVSLLMPYCFAAALSEPGIYCAVANERRTELFLLSASSSRFEPLGILPGTFHANEAAAEGWLVLNRADGPATLFDRNRRRAFELSEPVGSLALRDEILATARAVEGKHETVVSLYTVRE